MNATQRLTLPLRSPLLDRRLLDGADPRREPALEQRGRRVCSRRRRDRLAGDLERMAAGVTDVAARTSLFDLARRLRSDAPVDPQGVLLARRLLSGPPAPGVAAVRRANAALNPR